MFNEFANMVPAALEWSGCITALIGSALLAMGNTRLAGYGFCLFLASNGFWIAFAMLIGSNGMLVMQLGFTLTSCLGIYRWLFAGRAMKAEAMLQQAASR